MTISNMPWSQIPSYRTPLYNPKIWLEALPLTAGQGNGVQELPVQQPTRVHSEHGREVHKVQQRVPLIVRSVQLGQPDNIAGKEDVFRGKREQHGEVPRPADGGVHRDVERKEDVGLLHEGQIRDHGLHHV